MTTPRNFRPDVGPRAVASSSDLIAGVEHDADFLAINPGGFIPAIQDGDVTMVESIAIMEYLLGRYGPTPLAPDPHDPAFLRAINSRQPIFR